jgi:hypothetical protein
MRILRGLTGRVLPCGCLVGVYETYEGRVVATIDACGPACFEPEHRLHAPVSPTDRTDLPVDPTGPEGNGRRA